MDDLTIARRKRHLRDQAQQRRSELDPAHLAQLDQARTERLLADIDPDAVVATYLSRPGEPDTNNLAALLWRRGNEVLVPKLSMPGSGRLTSPHWVAYENPSDIRIGWQDIPEPCAAPLGPEALAQADIVLASGLAGGRDGSRLGVGGGWYDRALPHARPDVPVWLLLYSWEVVDAVPRACHDHGVDRIYTETDVIIASG